MTDNSKSIKNTFSKQYKNHLKKETRRKTLQTINKKLKRNHQPKQARRKNWLPDGPDDWDQLDYEQNERIMPRSEGERRRALERVAFHTAEPKTNEPDMPLSQVDDRRGLVVEVSQGLYRVDVGGRILLCHLRGTLKATETGFTNVVAVGDEVIVSEDVTDNGVIETVLPRRSIFARADVFHNHLQQIIVANADQLLIVSAWREPTIWLELIDRYLITAERNYLPALMCLNKMDLVEDDATLQATLQPYSALGYPIILTSALTGQGIAELRTWLHGRITVLAGLSGVGKSSLLAAVQPGLHLRIGAVSEYSGEGRHTTTQATLLRLNPDTVVVDTPGIREFGLSGLRQQELSHFFPEIIALAPYCRFANCAHLNEPDCAVRAAEANGRIAASRYHSYRQIYETLPES